MPTELKNAYKILVDQLEERRLFGSGWENYIKLNLQEISGENVEWLYLVPSALAASQLVWISFMKYE
jgi:hypothetical protein